jgi:DNA-binding SARP family transcriptional activator
MSLDLVHALLPPDQRGRAPTVHLFDGPSVSLCTGRRLTVPEGCKRLLVFVALHDGRVERRHAAGALWPLGDDDRAAGNLRSALWRLNRAEIDVLVADRGALLMRPEVLVDVRVLGQWASRLITGRTTAADLAVMPEGMDSLDLLPGWYDDWVLIERERMRQRVLHALEALSRQLRLAGRCAEAVEVALMAVNAEPLRESAQRELLESHLAEGNWVEGRRSYQTYCDRLWRELGVRPSDALGDLLGLRRPQPPLAVRVPSPRALRPEPPAHIDARMPRPRGRVGTG